MKQSPKEFAEWKLEEAARIRLEIQSYQTYFKLLEKEAEMLERQAKKILEKTE